MVQSQRKTVWQLLRKLRIEFPYDAAVLLLGIDPNELKTRTSTETHTLRLIVYNSYVSPGENKLRIKLMKRIIKLIE